MNSLDPLHSIAPSLAAVQDALAAAYAAPAAAPSSAPEDDDADISTPRARAASALEAALHLQMDSYRGEDDRAGEDLCRAMIDMCLWHEHPSLRDQVLALQERGLALLLDAPDGVPSMADVGDIEDDYQQIKPRADDAEAIAAALGMTVEEARAFGLIGTLDHIGLDDDEAPHAAQVSAASPEPEEDLETLFRREALLLVSRTLPQALQRFWSEQHSMDALIGVRRGFHTLKGDARVTKTVVAAEIGDELEGLAVLSEAAEDIIDYLLGDDYDTAQPAPALPPGAFSLLNEVATALRQRLDSRTPLPNEPALLRRLEAMQRKAASASGTAIDEASLAAKIPMPAPVRPAPTPRQEPAPSHSLLPTFLEEADRLMADLHRALAALSADSSDEGALVRARVKLHTLKGGAALVGDPAQDIQRIAHSAEDLFELIEDFQLSGALSGVPKEVLDGVLDAEDALQALVDDLRRRGQTIRLQITAPLPPIAAGDLALRLDIIAGRVRSGTLGAAEVVPAPPGVEPVASAPTADAVEAFLTMSGAPPEPTIRPVAPGVRRPTPRRPVPTPAVPDLFALGVQLTGPGLAELSFRDLLGRSAQTEIRSRTAALDRAQAMEDRARLATGPFTLFTFVQQLSYYEERRERYRALLGHFGRIYVFGLPDCLPTPEEHITLVPLADGDAVLAERVALLDLPEGPVAFIAIDTATHPSEVGRRFLSATIEDTSLLQEAAGSIRAMLQRDAALIVARRADLPEAAPATPESQARAAGEIGHERNLAVALRSLEELSVNRDALQELVGSMARQSVESHRSTGRLRTLVERVGAELAGLRSELVRTTRRTGDWDLLEKEEYTTIDVLLMQLDEALADLEESDNTFRRDLGETRAQVEVQADNQLRAQRALLDMSMIPLSQIEDRLHHAVRMQSRRLNKQVEFQMEGGDLLLDGRIANSLFEPLMHLINNAIDHGIEENAAARAAVGKPAVGRLTVRGRASGDGVVIEVSDDGRGIDPERIAAVAVSRGLVTAQEAAAMSMEERQALIWRPGFSTARTVSTISGRGIGMKSVHDDVSSLQGRIEVRSDAGRGTTFAIVLPRSLAMLRVEVVREGKDLLAFPITQAVATYPVPYEEVAGLEHGQTVQAGDRRLSVYSAHLGNGPAGDGEAGQGLLVEVTGRTGGILVDEVIGSQYLPVRAAPGFLRRQCGLLGYAVGGAGRILPILDLPTLVDRSQRDQPVLGRVVETPTYTVLVVDDSQTMRRALRDTLVKAGFQVREATDGRDALTQCSRAMPDLITLDMEMPGMDGLEALSALRQLPNGGPVVPVFMITSRQQARHRAAALAAGVTRYFTKPYDADELIGAAHLVLAEEMQQRAAAS